CLLHSALSRRPPPPLPPRRSSDLPTRDNRNAVMIARIAEQSGIQALAIHGRTRADRFNGEAEFETIGEVARSVEIPVIANGDIRSEEHTSELQSREKLVCRPLLET